MRVTALLKRKPTMLAITVAGGALIFATLCQLTSSPSRLKIWTRRAEKGFKRMSTQRPTTRSVSYQSSLSEEDLAARFAERRRHLKDACHRLNLTGYRGIRDAENRFIFPTNTTPTVLYCPVPKTGTTFLKKTFARTSNQSSVIWIDRFYVRPVSDYDSAVMFFFTREPYSRILSAYVDKLWSPNLHFWRVLGRPLVEAVRPYATATSLKCGHDVTFPEFIRYFIDGFNSGERVNTHLVPTHKFCEVCDFDYDYIGKLETFRDDVAYILSAINVTSADNYDNERDIITEQTGQAFYTLAMDRTHCLSKRDLLLRAWRALQIRGSISMDVRFPLSGARTASITKEIFTLVVQKTVQDSKRTFRDLDQNPLDQSTPGTDDFRFVPTSPTGQPPSKKKLDARAEQKRKTLASAYSLVPLEDRIRLSQLLTEEFELFEYEAKNQDVFAPVGTLYNNIFDISRI